MTKTSAVSIAEHMRVFVHRSGVPVLVIVTCLVVFWYVMSIVLNAPMQIDRFTRAQTDYSTKELIVATWSQSRPILPAPHQVLSQTIAAVFTVSPTSNKSLLYHGWVTLSATLLGFVLGSILGILLAVAIVHSKTCAKALMPWIIASQTVPILAIAPMIIVVLGAIGLQGLLPKALIAMYLSFFPVAIGMVKGLLSPEVTHMQLMRAYSAHAGQIFWLLRLPASLPFLFASLKVAIAASLVGAIVAELPTGAQSGLGARLLVGSYYGQTVQMWAALFTAALLAALLVSTVAAIERRTLDRMGYR